MTLQKIHTVSDPQIELERKIDAITKLLSRPYFNTILKDLSKRNFENAITICNYINTEQIELNIKNSTKEGKIKIQSGYQIIFKIKNLLNLKINYSAFNYNEVIHLCLQLKQKY